MGRRLVAAALTIVLVAAAGLADAHPRDPHLSRWVGTTATTGSIFLIDREQIVSVRFVGISDGAVAGTSTHVGPVLESFVGLWETQRTMVVPKDAHMKLDPETGGKLVLSVKGHGKMTIVLRPSGDFDPQFCSGWGMASFSSTGDRHEAGYDGCLYNASGMDATVTFKQRGKTRRATPLTFSSAPSIWIAEVMRAKTWFDAEPGAV